MQRSEFLQIDRAMPFVFNMVSDLTRLQIYILFTYKIHFLLIICFYFYNFHMLNIHL